MGVLDGKGAIVTGGSRGIGAAVVKRLVADGATVLFTYRQDLPAAHAVVEDCAGRATAVRVDLGDPADIARLYEQGDAVLDGLDIVVNNAGTATTGLIAEVTEADYDAIMAVNTKGVFLSLQHAARRIRDGGRIINVSTLNTVVAGPGVAVYAASKAAVEQFTVVAARELGGRGVTVNTVLPGPTDTDLLRSVNSDAALRTAVTLTPLGRLGEPADIADVVAFLAGPDGRWITGQRLVAGGGIA